MKECKFFSFELNNIFTNDNEKIKAKIINTNIHRSMMNLEQEDNKIDAPKTNE